MDPAQILPSYSTALPTNQSAIDILAGHWVSAFPEEMGLKAGSIPHFSMDIDTRVREISEIYNLKNRSVLEIGPLEAYQTKHLNDVGANPILSIEANDIAFLKCLIVKEILNLRANFMHGDSIKYLQENDRIFDVIWASGVLYHSVDPLLMLELICERAKAIFVWTHYWSEAEIRVCENASVFDASEDTSRTLGEFTAKYHYRTYGDANFAGFSGGLTNVTYWMERTEIISFVTSKGFTVVHERHDPNAPPGPAMLFFAVKD